MRYLKGKYDHGFTLSELLVSMTISGLVMVAIYSSYVSQSKASQIQGDVTLVQQNLRAGMYLMVEDIRMAGYDPTENAGASIISGSITSNPQSTIQVSWDSNEDGVISSGTSEVINYQWDNTDSTLERAEGLSPTSSSWETVAENITGLEFTFLNSSGTTTTNASDVRTIQITLQGSNNGHSRQFTTQVLCRNLNL